MDGVGEDEKAYNYICNLDKVNLGGPGWFNDVFRVRILSHFHPSPHEQNRRMIPPWRNRIILKPSLLRTFPEGHVVNLFADQICETFKAFCSECVQLTTQLSVRKGRMEVHVIPFTYSIGVVVCAQGPLLRPRATLSDVLCCWFGPSNAFPVLRVCPFATFLVSVFVLMSGVIPSAGVRANTYRSDMDGHVGTIARAQAYLPTTLCAA